MTTIAFITIGGMGFILGLYVSSQIMEHVDSSRRNKKFMENLEKFDKQEKDCNGTR
jgi:hypothetical protein|tara:strand:- start:9 stop:176 length:168 start_codon:yes stop_codon:yes gene_type:complete